MIISSTNKVIKEIKSLYKKKSRWNEKSFFIEGIRAVEQCILAKGNIKYIVYSQKVFSTDYGNELIDSIMKKEYKTYQISDELFKEIGDTENPQGILAVVGFEEYELKDVILEEKNFIIILDRVQDPGNMGTIIRTADAFGANAIIITGGCVDIYNPKVVRSTMGSIFQIPTVHIEDISQVIANLKNKDIKIISTSLEAENYCYNIDFKGDCALVIGNEATGISQEVVVNSDYLTKIPMTGEAESLNAAIASGVIMYEVLRQRTKVL